MPILYGVDTAFNAVECQCALVGRVKDAMQRYSPSSLWCACQFISIGCLMQHQIPLTRFLSALVGMLRMAVGVQVACLHTYLT
jgi:hypothetical protein